MSVKRGEGAEKSNSYAFIVYSRSLTSFNLNAKNSLFLGIWFCGSFTTVSAFVLVSLTLLESRQFALFGLNGFRSVGTSTVAVIVGRIIALGLIWI